jgi:hypothetical protein
MHGWTNQISARLPLRRDLIWGVGARSDDCRRVPVRDGARSNLGRASLIGRLRIEVTLSGDKLFKRTPRLIPN